MQFIYSFVSSVSVCSAGLADSSSEAVSAASVVSAGAASSERSVSGLGLSIASSARKDYSSGVRTSFSSSGI